MNHDPLEWQAEVCNIRNDKVIQGLTATILNVPGA